MIAVVEACEEPEPELNGMQEMGNDNEEMETAKEEFDRLELFDAFEVVDPSVLTTKPLDMIWVKEYRSGKLKMRLCVRGFLKASGSKDSLYSPTPFPETMKVLLALAHLKGAPQRAQRVHCGCLEGFLAFTHQGGSGRVATA